MFARAWSKVKAKNPFLLGAWLKKLASHAQACGPPPSKSGHMFMKQAVAGSIPGFLKKGNVPHFQRLHWLQTVDVVDAGPF